jgi:hypothetical protein
MLGVGPRTYRFVGLFVDCSSISQRPSRTVSFIEHTGKIELVRSRVDEVVSRSSPSVSFHGLKAAPPGLTSHSETRLDRATSTSTYSNGINGAHGALLRTRGIMLSKRGWCWLTGSFVVHAAIPGGYHSTHWARPLSSWHSPNCP